MKINETAKAKAFFKEAKRFSTTGQSHKKISKYQLTSLVNEGLVSLTEDDNVKAFTLFESAVNLSF